MTDPEKLTALKKAYADTILNTAKEAAARVMISEKKARGYQLELVGVRDEALRTCLRLKHMYDLKVKEAEAISLKKQQKIEELEAQLGEAEDIVGELRMELRESRYLLDKLVNGHRMNLSNEDNKASEVVSLPREEDSSNHERSTMANGIKPHSNERDFSINRCSYKENQDPCHYTLPSILSRRKDAEALRTNVANGDCCPDVESLISSKTEARKEIENNDMEISTTPVSPPANQCIKFTFKRKRKKDASSNSSPEGESLSSSQDDDSRRSRRQKTGEKDIDSFNNEPSRDSRRVAQVARQLLPFSEKKV